MSKKSKAKNRHMPKWISNLDSVILCEESMVVNGKDEVSLNVLGYSLHKVIPTKEYYEFVYKRQGHPSKSFYVQKWKEYSFEYTSTLSEIAI